MKPVIVNLFEGEKREGDERLVIDGLGMYLEICCEEIDIKTGLATGFCWGEYIEGYVSIPVKYFPAIIEALKQVSEGGE